MLLLILYIYFIYREYRYLTRTYWRGCRYSIVNIEGNTDTWITHIASILQTKQVRHVGNAQFSTTISEENIIHVKFKRQKLPIR